MMKRLNAQASGGRTSISVRVWHCQQQKMRLEKEAGLKLGNAQYAIQRSWNFIRGTRGTFTWCELTMVDPCG